MKNIIIILSLFIGWSSFSQSEENPDRILTYGLPNYNYRKAMEFVGKEWGIELYPVAGCMVSRKLVDSVKAVHKKLWKKMDSIHGIDSEEQFRKETKIEMKRVIEVWKVFESDRQIKKRRKIIERKKEDTLATLDSISSSGIIYYWTIFSFEKDNNPEFKWEPEFKVGVNLSTGKLEILEQE